MGHPKRKNRAGHHGSDTLPVQKSNRDPRDRHSRGTFCDLCQDASAIRTMQFRKAEAGIPAGEPVIEKDLNLCESCLNGLVQVLTYMSKHDLVQLLGMVLNGDFNVTCPCCGENLLDETEDEESAIGDSDEPESGASA